MDGMVWMHGQLLNVHANSLQVDSIDTVLSYDAVLIAVGAAVYNLHEHVDYNKYVSPNHPLHIHYVTSILLPASSLLYRSISGFKNLSISYLHRALHDTMS